MKLYFVKSLPKPQIDPVIESINTLFLCSHIINVGDKVYNELSGFGVVKEITREEDFLGVKYDSQPWEVEEDFKYIVRVIGEISSKAIWVSPGDEFYEEEIKIISEMDFSSWYHKNYQPHQRMEVYEIKYQKYCITANKIVQILNSTCKHFH